MSRLRWFAFLMVLPVLGGCCFLCSTIELSYELQVRDGSQPVAGAQVTFSGYQGLPSQTAVTGKDGRCEFFAKRTWRFLEGGYAWRGFQISVLHPDYVPLRFQVHEEELIKEETSYHRSESVHLSKVHFRLECAAVDVVPLAAPLCEFLKSRDLRAEVSVYVGFDARYMRPQGLIRIAPNRPMAVVLLITPVLLESTSVEAMLRHAGMKDTITPVDLIPVLLGPVTDAQRAEIQSAFPQPVHSIASYDGRTPVPAEQFAGLVELLQKIALEPRR